MTPAPSAIRFPPGFIWGVATAAPQIEGAAFEGGKGESIWDRLARVPGKIANGDTLDVACDHYHRYPHDFALMQRMGIKNYRLSVSWPRIYPSGDGAVNQQGLDFYTRLIDSVLAHGITPWVTLFHWDLPQALEDKGGWRKRVVPDAFALYARTVVKTLSDRVTNWITVNEIRAFTRHAYGEDWMAPAVVESPKVVNQTYHHALLCHGHAVRAVREYGASAARVGITDNPEIPVPVVETESDIAAAKAWFLERNAHILGAIYTGGYSDEYLVRCGPDRPVVESGDMDLISEPTDFLGMNVYTGFYVRAARGRLHEQMHFPSEYPQTASSWLKVMPQVMYWAPRLASEVYGVEAIYITENGCGYDHEPVIDGEVNDLHRRDLIRNYLRELHRAVTDGVPVLGYFLWSFMDNFEWKDGYTRRFGIVHTNYLTQERTPKLSAAWYSTVIRENRLV